MRHTTHVVPETVKPYVEYVWSLESGEECTELGFDSFASGTSGLIIQHHRGRSAFTDAITVSGHEICRGALPMCFVFGPLAEPVHTAFAEPFAATGVVFKPYALSMLLKVNATELADRLIDVRAFSWSSIHDQLVNAGGNVERMALLLRFLDDKARAAAPRDDIVGAGLHLIHRLIQPVRLSEVLRALNVSERQLERRFLRVVGVTPHRYIRLVRFQKAIRRLQGGLFDHLSDLAYDLGYADQAHFIKEFKEMSGQTPTTLVRSVRDWIPEHQRVAGRVESLTQPDGSAASFRG